MKLFRRREVPEHLRPPASGPPLTAMPPGRQDRAPDLIADWGCALRPGPAARMFIPPEVAAERGWLAPPAPAFPEGLQLDLACLLGRLKQIEREGGTEAPHWLMDRVLSCDLPRMVKYLTPETVARLREADAEGYWEAPGA